MGFYIKPEQSLLSKEKKEAETWSHLAFICLSLLFHFGFFFVLVNFDRSPAPQRNMETIAVEIVQSEPVTKTEERLASEVEGVKESNAASAPNLPDLKHVKTKEDQAEKAGDPSSKDQAEHPSPQEKAVKSSKPQEVSETNPDTQASSGEHIQKDRQARKADNPAIKGTKVASKSGLEKNDARAPKHKNSDPSVSPQSKQKESALLSGLSAEKPEPSYFNQGNAKVAYPNIPFDPQVFRAVAVPLPSPGGGEAVSYKEIVFGLLERAKHYPESALSRGAKGAAVIAFALDADGNVIQHSLLKSSGEPDLDAESLEIIERASPFPPPPQGAPRSFAAEIGFGIETNGP